MNNYVSTKDWNVDFLIRELGFNKYGNRVLFTRDNTILYSPAIANDANWFDLRKNNFVIFNRQRYRNLFVLLRLVKLNAFALFEYSEIEAIMNDNFRENNGGTVWSFIYEKRAGNIYVWSKSEASRAISAKILNKAELEEEMFKITNRFCFENSGSLNKRYVNEKGKVFYTARKEISTPVQNLQTSIKKAIRHNADKVYAKEDWNNKYICADTLLRHVGKEFFVKYYRELSKSQELRNGFYKKIVEENYTYNSFNTKISVSRRIFKEGLDKAALEVIANSSNVSYKTRLQARKLLGK